VTLKLDLNEKQMKAALRDLKMRVQGGDEVVFYYSGHRVQFGGTNYLIPLDCFSTQFCRRIEQTAADDDQEVRHSANA
jgi:uncharacterized caspase-like protein